MRRGPPGPPPVLPAALHPSCPCRIDPRPRETVTVVAVRRRQKRLLAARRLSLHFWRNPVQSIRNQPRYNSAVQEASVESVVSSKPKVGLIGLGLMGQPIGMNLLKAGHPLTVWNRTESRANELIAMGATLAKSPKDAAAASDVLLTIVSDPPALESVLWGADGEGSGALAGLKPGSTYIDSSTVSPALARKIAAACAERKVRFLDAPVTGGDWGAKKCELIFMVGGDAETLKAVEPILAVLGKRWFHLGPNGAGQTIKLAMNLILALQVDALAEALALVTGAGLKG